VSGTTACRLGVDTRHSPICGLAARCSSSSGSELARPSRPSSPPANSRSCESAEACNLPRLEFELMHFGEHGARSSCVVRVRCGPPLRTRTGCRQNRLSPGGLGSSLWLYIQSEALQEIPFHRPRSGSGPGTRRVGPRRHEHRARGVDLASVVFEPPASRRLRDPDRLLPSFCRSRAVPKSPDGRGSI
jgi:hypothetical protein